VQVFRNYFGKGIGSGVSVATDGRQQDAHHTEPGGPWLIGLGIMRRIVPLERIASFGWRTVHGGFGMVD
jgi:hypothetical protein